MEPVSTSSTISTASTLAFGIALKRARKAAGLTQAELAERAAFSVVYIGMLERGARQPQRSTVALLADALALAERDRLALEAAAQLPSALPSIKRRAKTDADALHLPVGGFLGAQPTTRLVGREREFKLITDTLEAVAGGQGRLLVLVGEPGIGKTRLAQEAALLALARHFCVLTGRCYEPQEGVAYYPFLEALAEAFPLAQESSISPGAERWQEVARLLPDQPASAPTPTAVNDSAAQQRLYWQVSDLLGTLSERDPVVLLLDDLQWADRASLELLQYLARHLRERPILLVGTAREVESQRQRPLVEALSDLRREELLERVAIRPLAADETSALIGATLGGADGADGNASTVAPDLAELIYARSDGNPFFTRQLAKALQEQDELRFVEGEWCLSAISADASVHEAPEGIRTVIGQRLARLTPLTQEVLREASVLGQVFAFGEVQRMGGRGEQEVEEALEETVAVGIVREGERDRYHFNHALTRDTLYAQLSARRRRRLHLAAAGAIERTRDHERRAAELAYHLWAADEGARALPYALLAGDQAEAVYAHAEAEGLYQTALRLARELAQPEGEAEALERLAMVLVRRGRYQEALALVEAALLAYHALGNVEAEGRVAEGLYLTHFPLMTNAVGVARLAPLIDDLCARGLSLIGQARLYAALSMLLVACGYYASTGEEAARHCAEGLAAAERAVKLAHNVGHEGLQARALRSLGQSLDAMGRYAEALDAFEGLVPLAEVAGDLGTLRMGWAIAEYHRMVRGDFRQSQAHIDRALALSEHASDPFDAALAWLNQAELAYHRGDWGQARSAVERSLQIVRAHDLSVRDLGMAPQLFLSWLYLVAGDDEQADALVAAPLAIAQELHDLQELRWSYQHLAERDLLAGRAAEARAELEPLLERPGIEEPQALWVLPQYAWAKLELGEVDDAEARALQSCQQARARGHQIWLVDALRILALVRLRQQRWDEAVAALAEALERARAMPYPYAELKALWVYGRLEAARSDVAAARMRFTQALAICGQLGEGLYRKRIEHDLADLTAHRGSIIAN
jgi:tetratricopeptide (TPR) repeat protein/transcriptional regulator with XRE-family HTH domain